MSRWMWSMVEVDQCHCCGTQSQLSDVAFAKPLWVLRHLLSLYPQAAMAEWLSADCAWVARRSRVQTAQKTFVFLLQLNSITIGGSVCGVHVNSMWSIGGVLVESFGTPA